jgi:hypothetical protein
LPDDYQVKVCASFPIHHVSEENAESLWVLFQKALMLEERQCWPHELWHCRVPVPANSANPPGVAKAQHVKPRHNAANLISLLVSLLWKEEKFEQEPATMLTFCSR